MTFRKLIFDNQVWLFFVGRKNIVIKNDQARKWVVPKELFHFDEGVSNADMEASSVWNDEGNPIVAVSYIISPEKIKQYILSRLI
jgi:hypothetical protein